MNTPITDNTLLTRNPDLVSADMDGETVMMSIERGEYFGLGGIGPRIWDLISLPINMTQIIQTICHEYEVNEDTCTADVRRYMQELLELGLIQQTS